MLHLFDQGLHVVHLNLVQGLVSSVEITAIRRQGQIVAEADWHHPCGRHETLAIFHVGEQTEGIPDDAYVAACGVKRIEEGIV